MLASPRPVATGWFHQTPAGAVHGPVVLEALCTLWRLGELTEETPVKPEGGARFVLVKDAPALLAILRGARALPPRSLPRQPPAHVAPSWLPPAQAASNSLHALLHDAEESLSHLGASSAPAATYSPTPRRAELPPAQEGDLAAQRAEVARLRARLEEDVSAFEAYKAQSLALIASKRALLEA